MKILINEVDFENAKTRDLVPIECDWCKKGFLRLKKIILEDQKHRTKSFCSRKCMGESQITQIKGKCAQCFAEIIILPCYLKKSTRHFCNSSCSAKYNNTHSKKRGNRRSKLEYWIQSKLNIIYPELAIDYNKNDTINSELDIYIPSLRLAIELNGIFHYEPIFGQDKLDKIQNNDHRKLAACAERQISFCVIDTTGLKYWKEANAQKYLDIIINIINEKLAGAAGPAPATLRLTGENSTN